MNTKVELGNYKQPEQNMNAILVIEYKHPVSEMPDFPEDCRKDATITRLAASGSLQMFSFAFETQRTGFDVLFWLSSLQEEGEPIQNSYWFANPDPKYSLVATEAAWIEVYPHSRKKCPTIITAPCSSHDSGSKDK